MVFVVAGAEQVDRRLFIKVFDLLDGVDSEGTVRKDIRPHLRLSHIQEAGVAEPGMSQAANQLFAPGDNDTPPLLATLRGVGVAPFISCRRLHSRSRVSSGRKLRRPPYRSVSASLARLY